MQQAILVDITFLKQHYQIHQTLSKYPEFFDKWLIERLHCIFNVPLSVDCLFLMTSKPTVENITDLDSFIWSLFHPINRLSAHITNNPLNDYKLMGNLFLLIF